MYFPNDFRINILSENIKDKTFMFINDLFVVAYLALFFNNPRPKERLTAKIIELAVLKLCRNLTFFKYTKSCSRSGSNFRD